MSFVQKILVDSDHHEFAVTQKVCDKDVSIFVTFDLIDITLLYYNSILEFMRKRSMLTLKLLNRLK